jgi:DNA topoisomerase IA
MECIVHVCAGYFSCFQVKMVEKQTSPPDYLTESELITLMEKHCIGTDASIPVHINNICERNYVSVLSGRKLKPQPLGIVLVHGYQKVIETFSTVITYPYVKYVWPIRISDT